VLHTTPAAAAGRKFSAGLKLDGTPFRRLSGHPASVTSRPHQPARQLDNHLIYRAGVRSIGRAMICVPVLLDAAVADPVNYA
jgi:hypothetical protein